MIFAEGDKITTRVEVAREDRTLPDGKHLTVGALELEAEFIPICPNYDYSRIVGIARSLERDGNSVTLEVELPTEFDPDLFDFGIYADSLVISHEEDVDKVLWARVRAVGITAKSHYFPLPQKEQQGE